LKIQESPQKEQKIQINGTKEKKQNVPFKRVREDEVEFIDPRLANNSYRAKGGDQWGEKASEDLIKTRGKGFRHAKTKKKKGTYRGGPIDMGVNSIKFNYDD